MSNNKHLVNPALQTMALAAVLKFAKDKQAFVPGGDPGMDPSAGGGAPPMGGDPSMAAGGAPPPAPAPAAPMAPAMQSVEPIKPKIDVNVTMLQILKLLARISDALGIPVPASEMVATQNDLTQMGMQQAQGGGAAAGGAGQSAIPPIAPVGAAAPGMGGKTASHINNGVGFNTDGLDSLTNRASAIARLRSTRAA